MDSCRLVLTTLNETLAKEPNRKCFRLIGGVLVERTVKDVVPALNTNRDGVSSIQLFLDHLDQPRLSSIQIRQLLSQLVNQYKSKEVEFNTFTSDYNIRLGSAR